MPYWLQVELLSGRPYLDTVALFLNSDWTPSFQRMMTYAPVDSTFKPDVVEPFDLDKLRDVIRQKGERGEVIEFDATHPGLGEHFNCGFAFFPNNSFHVSLTVTGWRGNDVVSTPDFEFYFRSVIQVLVDQNVEITTYSFKYTR